MDLSVDGNSDYASTGTPDSATPVSNSTTGLDGSDLVAAMFNGLLVAVPALQVLLGSALTLKGSAADLATRLARAIETDGALRKGTVFPGTPIGGQPFWRTDQALFYVYDAVSGQWVLGQDNPLYALLDGTRDFTGNIKIKSAVPGYRLKGTEVSGRDILIAENAGSLYFYDNTGTEGVPIWTQRFKVNMAGGGVDISSTLAIVGNLDLTGTMNSGTVPLARLATQIPQANMANASIGTPQLKTATGASSTNVPTGTSVVTAYALNDYSWSPLVIITAPGLRSQMFSTTGADPGTPDARFQVLWDNTSGGGFDATGIVRWRYMTASDNPDVWVIADGAGKIVASWWSDDPIPGGGAPIAVEGLTARRVTIEELAAIKIPNEAMDAAMENIVANDLKLANLEYRALQQHAGDAAPSGWLLDNLKLTNGAVIEMSDQEKVDLKASSGKAVPRNA